MTSPPVQLAAVREFLAEQVATPWFKEAIAKVSDGAVRALNLQFSMVPHRVPADRLLLDAAGVAGAQAIRADWRPDTWTLRDAARVAILLFSSDSPEVLADRAQQLFITADLGESLSLYRGLAVYPEGHRYIERAREGTRSNIPDIFKAIAWRNPFPAQFFPEDAWNQLVLKNHFLGEPTAPMVGIDGRCNADLARMLVDYARERRAASRTVPKDLWRCVGKYATADMHADIRLTAAAADPVEAAAGRQALFDAGLGPDTGTTWPQLFPA